MHESLIIPRLGRTLWIAIVILLAPFQNSIATPNRYEVIDLGSLGGDFTQSIPRGVNNYGDVVGQAITDPSVLNPQYHAFLFHDGVMQDIDPGSQGSNVGSLAFAINDAGRAFAVDLGPVQGYFYENGIYTFVPTSVGGSLIVDVEGANDIGQIVGSVNNGAQRAMVYSNGSIVELGTLGGNVSRALAINSKRSTMRILPNA